jgi:hypothetical protein
MLSYISYDQLQQDWGEVGGVTSPEAVVVLHLADDQQQQKEEGEVGDGPLAAAGVGYISHDQLQLDEGER